MKINKIYLVVLLILVTAISYGQWNTNGNNNGVLGNRLGTSTPHSIDFYTFGQQHMTLSTQGLLGINTANPQAPLHIKANNGANGNNLTNQGWLKGIYIEDKGTITFMKATGQTNNFFMGALSNSQDFWLGTVPDLTGFANPKYSIRVYGTNGGLGLAGSQKVSSIQMRENTFFVGTDKTYVGVNTLEPKRVMDIVDGGIGTANSQLRLSYTQNNNPNLGIYTDFKADNFGLDIVPRSNNTRLPVTIHGKIGVQTPIMLDVNGNGKFRGLPNAVWDATNNTNVDKIVAVANDGTLYYKDANSISGSNVTANNGVSILPLGPPGITTVQLGAMPGSGAVPFAALTSDRQIPMNNQDVFWSGQGIGGNRSLFGYDPMSGPFPIPSSTVAALTNATVNPNINTYAGHFRNFNFHNAGSRAIGVTGISDQNQTLLGMFNIGGEFISQGSISTNIGVNSISAGGNDAIGFSTDVFSGINTTVGISANSSGQSLQTYGGFFTANSGNDTYGVYADAQGAATSNYAIFGRVQGSGQPSGMSPGDYAGFFMGDVFCSSGNYFASETVLKQNIQPLQNALNTLNKISATSFNFNTANYPSVNLPTGLEYGVIAENIDTVLPDLVRDITSPTVYDSTGAVVHPMVTFKGVNYTELIPWLIAGVNELDGLRKTQNGKIAAQDSIIAALQANDQSQDSLINDLEGRLAHLENCLSAVLPLFCWISNNNIQGNNLQQQERLMQIMNVVLEDEQAVILEQNIPNPFAEQTTIQFSIPQNVKDAKIVFYNINGQQIKEVNVIERGESQLQVYGSDLSTGIYTYALVVDGKVVDSKKMVKQ